MALFKKKVVSFKPNCNFDEDTGIYQCEPVMEVDGKIIAAEQPIKVKFDKTTNKFVIKEARGADEMLIDKLLDHLEKRKV